MNVEESVFVSEICCLPFLFSPEKKKWREADGDDDDDGIASVMSINELNGSNSESSSRKRKGRIESEFCA